MWPLVNIENLENIKGRRYKTPLHYLIEHEDKEKVIEALSTQEECQPGASWQALGVFHQDEAGDTPLHRAMAGGNMGIVQEMSKLIDEKSARYFWIKANDKDEIPLDLAVAKGHKEAIAHGLEKTAIAKFKDKNAILHLACERGYFHIVKELLKIPNYLAQLNTGHSDKKDLTVYI